MKADLKAKITVVTSWYAAKFSRDIYLPSLPAIMIALGTTQSIIQHTVAVYFLALGLSRFIFAPLSDIFGRRIIILWTVPLYVAGSILCFAAVNMPEFIIGRLMQGFGIGCVTAIGRAMVNDLYSKERTTKALAYLSITAVWAPAIATALGGFIQVNFGWRVNFLFLTLVGVALFLQCYFVLQETNKDMLERKNILLDVLDTYRQLITSRYYCRYLLTYSFIFAGTVVYFTESPFIFIHVMKISPQIYGYFAFGTISGMLIGKLIAAKATDYFSVDKVIMIGLFFGLTAGLIMLELAIQSGLSVVNILGPTILYFAALGVLSPTSKAASMGTKRGTAGSAAAIFGLGQGLASTFAGMLAARLHDTTGKPLAMVLIGLSCCGIISFLILQTRTKTHATK